MKTLVVEQAAEDYSAVYECLRQTDFLVESVNDGRRAVERAAQEKFDLIILDLVQPVESCLLTLHEIRESSRDSEILILSTPDQVKDRVTALIQGADDYLVKPVDSGDLRARIATLAQRRGQAWPADADNDDDGIRLNRMIQNLLQMCQREAPAVELVISETDLAQLVDDAIGRLRASAANRNIRIERSDHGFPDVLVDARWMEHLLVVLLDYALAQSPANAAIEIGFDGGNRARAERGVLRIDSRLSLTPVGGDTGEDDTPAVARRVPVDSLSLARFCADSLQLGLECSLVDNRQLQIRVSGLRML